MGLPEPTFVARRRAITDAPPSAAFEAVFCDDCDERMAPDPTVYETTNRNICPTCLEGYLP